MESPQSPSQQPRSQQSRSQQSPSQQSCHCGNAGGYEACCRRLHSGEREAATAEELMRARYSAYVEHDVAYLRRSWHPDTCPDDIVELPKSEWLGLTVVSTDRGAQLDNEGVVSFVALLQGATGVSELRETSRFTRVGGRWVYHDAVLG